MRGQKRTWSLRTMFGIVVVATLASVGLYRFQAAYIVLCVISAVIYWLLGDIASKWVAGMCIVVFGALVIASLPSVAWYAVCQLEGFDLIRIAGHGIAPKVGGVVDGLSEVADAPLRAVIGIAGGEPVFPSLYDDVGLTIRCQEPQRRSVFSESGDF